MKQTTTWVLVADEAIARVLERPEGDGDLVAVEELTDPAAHRREGELAEQGPQGRRTGGGAAGHGAGSGRAHAMAPAGDSERHLEAQAFARRVADRLATLLAQHRYDTLHVVAAPRFLGYLRRVWSSQVEKAVASTLDKDLVHMSHAEITKALDRQLHPPHRA